MSIRFARLPLCSALLFALAGQAVAQSLPAPGLRAPGSISYDAEGVPTRRLELIGGGRLGAFLHNSYTARRGGATTTGSAVRGGFKSPPGVGARSLHLVPGDLTAEEILASVPEALFVQSVTLQGGGLHLGETAELRVN